MIYCVSVRSLSAKGWPASFPSDLSTPVTEPELEARLQASNTEFGKRLSSY